MIYKVLKVLVKLTMYFFFKNKIILNANKIPLDGPTILVANHPVTFLDPLLVAVSTNRQVHFLAKGAMFKNGFIRMIFKAFKMIPVYRAQDNPSEMSKNEDTFNYCYEHLEKGGLVLIFPEGISVTDRTLKPLKTGVARIALCAEERNDFSLGVNIVPIGLTYEAPHQFRKDVLVNVGNPINVGDFRAVYLTDERKAVKDLTNKIREQLEVLTLNVSQPELTNLVDFLIMENAQRGIDFQNNVAKIKEILTELTAKSSSYDSHELVEKMRMLNQKGKEIGLQNLSSDKGAGKIMLESIISIITFVFGIPLLLFGFLHNAVPYYLSPVLARWVSKEYEYQGPITMTAGMVICLILYPIYFGIMFAYSESLLFSMCYLLSIPIVGIIAYGFFEQLNGLKLHWKFLFLFNKKSEQVAEFILERKELLLEINRLRLDV